MYLFTGKGGKSGSWQIRGEQLGSMGSVIPHCTDPKGFDAAVVVKRVPEQVIHGFRDHGVPWVWDIVDAYPQPHCLSWTKSEAIAWVRKQVEQWNPSGIIWPNRKMMEDCDINLPQTVLYHHHRPGIRLNPIREEVKTVGYEGGPYLGSFRGLLEEECSKRGWRFVINPSDITDLDIVVAFRDPTGYVPFSWKSPVKLANAHGSGTPFIGQPENGYVETQSGAEYWAGNRKEIATAFEWLTSQEAREQVHDRFLKCAYSLEAAQKDLKEFLCQFK